MYPRQKWSICLRLAMLLSALIAANGCVYSADDEVSLNTTVAQDKPYANALRNSTRTADVINNFEMRYKVNVTHLDASFRDAFAKRLQEIYRQQGPAFEEANAKTGFFVSISSPDHTAINLTNEYHWNIFLAVGNEPKKPVLIKRLNDKLRWKPFFDYVDAWSEEYLIVFDDIATTATDKASDLVVKNTFSLSLANADAKVTLNW